MISKLLTIFLAPSHVVLLRVIAELTEVADQELARWTGRKWVGGLLAEEQSTEKTCDQDRKYKRQGDLGFAGDIGDTRWKEHFPLGDIGNGAEE